MVLTSVGIVGLIGCDVWELHIVGMVWLGVREAFIWVCGGGGGTGGGG